MLINNYPEESTLRRHVDTHATFRLQAFMAEGPTDSTLRRHLEQMNTAIVSDANVMSEPATTVSAIGEEPAPVAKAETVEKGGFFAWLFRRFAG